MGLFKKIFRVFTGEQPEEFQETSDLFEEVTSSSNAKDAAYEENAGNSLIKITITKNTFLKEKEVISIAIPNTVTKLTQAQIADAKNYNITAIDLSDCDNVLILGDNVFSAFNFKKVILPENIEEIGERAFYGCDSLMKIDLSNCWKLKSIKGHAFESCCNLTHVRLPEDIEEIGEYAFHGCRSLEYII